MNNEEWGRGNTPIGVVMGLGSGSSLKFKCTALISAQVTKSWPGFSVGLSFWRLEHYQICQSQSSRDGALNLDASVFSMGVVP